jgi:tetratricopeptide (TPR) repeat protein
LKIEEECLPFDHSNLLIHIESIVDMYKEMNKIEKGLEFCKEKIHHQKKKLGENHFSIARIWKIMGDLVMNNNPTRGMQYYEKALSILENCAPSDRQAASKCLKDMAGIYGDFHRLEDALRYYHKALHLYREIWCSDHIEMANLLRLIAFGHAQMNDLSEAYRYYNESLAIYRAKFGPEHEDVKRVEAEITRLNNS